MASENVLTLTEANFATEIKNSTVPVLVDFWAEWCGPCKMLGPILDQIATEKAGSVKIGKVDVDSQSALAAQFNIRAMPTMLFFKNGEVKEVVVGLQSKDALVRKIDALA
jgi:thioredoxin 1